jgi:hypothetical protein
LIAPLEERLTAVEAAINATSRRFSRERLIYAVVISFLVGLTVVTALQALLNLPKPQAAATADATRANGKLDNGANGAATNGEAASAPIKREGEGVANAEATNAAKNASPVAAASSSTQTQSPRPTQATARDVRKPVAATAAAPATRGGAYVVRVLMEVKNGQVTDARVLNPRPGAGAYEALALRMARQRRYPENFSGGDTLRISVKP